MLQELPHHNDFSGWRTGFPMTDSALSAVLGGPAGALAGSKHRTTECCTISGAKYSVNSLFHSNSTVNLTS
jgi:hypothetical protein